jgi:hypothetical protein
MATPHVAGAAALLLAERPDLSVSQLRAALLDGVDRLGSLTGRVATGGRLDARRSLDLVAPVAASTTSAPAPSPQPAAPAPAPAAPAERPAPAVDRRAPRMSLRVKGRMRLRAVVKRGLAVAVSCTEPCSLRLRILFGPQNASLANKRLGTIVSRRVRVRLTRRAQIRLIRRGSAKVIVRAYGQDRTGNVGVVQRRITLTR